ncbi:LysR family transcriptional regulator [Ferrimonas marina]|uniref:DNA-binding transcriptional regulator, LysR family n=1 Tax=Ferrimonas marina TaxID=299255 RepID=A0A1M5X8P2_9GAMM|nr:LysR family transcriptional regulator [Ferrimonas marina]SHH96207.1 DNA-binding transcriptional regulator, LysR family [Ferrimonas marina]
MLKIELLESFIAIAECGNLSRAAEQVLRTQSAVSLQIKRLEGTVGKQLLFRDNKGVSLTPAGETLLVYARQMVQLNVAALDDLNRAQHTEVIRLGLPTDYVARYLNASILQFIRDFTSIELVLDTDVSGNLYRRLEQGELDLVVGTHWEHQPNAELLFERRFHWAGSKGGSAWERSPIPVALYPENCPIRTQVFARHHLSMPPLQVVLSSPSPEALCLAVENDLAIAPIADFRIGEQMQVLDDLLPLPKLPVFNESIYQGRTELTPAMRQLIELLRTQRRALTH